MNVYWFTDHCSSRGTALSLYKREIAIDEAPVGVKIRARKKLANRESRSRNSNF
jgi:hypothetical protein